MIIAITGGTGFIGRALTERFVAEKHHVRILSRQSQQTISMPKGVELISGDLTRVSKTMDTFLDGADILYHCAGQLKDTQSMSALHVNATRALAEAASHRIKHWVQLSSVGVYGSVKKGDITEDSPLQPLGHYESTKAESDKIVINAGVAGGFTYSILRPSNVFGPGMTNQSLFSMITMIARGLFFYIGKPGASANYIHVDNVVEGLIRCGTMQQAKGRIFNLSDYCTIEHFVEIIADELGCSRPSRRFRIPASITRLTATLCGVIPNFPLTQSRIGALTNRSFYPITRIQKELDYQHVVSIEDALRELVAVYASREMHSR